MLYNIHLIRKWISLDNLTEASHAFISATKEGPDYVCMSSNWLMYCKTVQKFHVSKYDKAPSEFDVRESVSAQDKQWICKTSRQYTNRSDTSVYPFPKTSISNPDDFNEAKEEAMLQGTLHVLVYSTSKGTCSSTVVEIEQPTIQGCRDQWLAQWCCRR